MLRDLWLIGTSALKIASEINRETGSDYTRSAVIGKAHRMKLARHRNSGERGGARARVNERRRAAMQRIVALSGKINRRRGPNLLAAPDDISCPLVSLSELTNETCRFPMWTGDTPTSDKFYCGAPEADLASGCPYCLHHARIAFVPYKSRHAAGENDSFAAHAVHLTGAH